MGLFIANEVKSLYVGDKAVVEVYLGSEKIWPESKNLICTYNITEPGETLICNSFGEVQSMIVDGVSMDPVNMYNFEEAGEHIVEFVGVDNIITSMFSDTVVQSIVIPNNVTTIDTYAFANCNCLYEITCLSTNLVVAKSAFVRVLSSGVLKVPAGSVINLESLSLPGGWIVEYI